MMGWTVLADFSIYAEYSVATAVKCAGVKPVPLRAGIRLCVFIVLIFPRIVHAVLVDGTLIAGYAIDAHLG